MKTQAERKIKISFPLRLYFQQLVCPNAYVRTLDPFSFWRRYKIRHLEACWEINLVRYLERCRKIPWQPSPQQQARDIEVIKYLINTGVYRGMPWEKNSQNTIFIPQPSFELKYRGVIYHTGSIMAVDGNQLAIEPSKATSNSSQITPASDQSNTSETSSKIV